MEPVKSARKTTMNLCFKVLLVSNAAPLVTVLFPTICTCSNVYNVPTNIVTVYARVGGCGCVVGGLPAKGE